MMDIIKLIQRYQNNYIKPNKEGKIDFCLELLEHCTEDQLNEEINRLIIMITKYKKSEES